MSPGDGASLCQGSSQWSGLSPAPQPYRSHFAQQLVLSLAKQGLTLDGSNGFWVQLSHGLAGQLGDDRIIEQAIPALLNLPKGEVAAELHTQLDRCQVIGLQHSVDNQEVIYRLPVAQILGHLKWLFALLHMLGESRGCGWAGWHRSARGLGHLLLL